ncbi:MAG TPA: hypothetical protein VJ302_30470 [Blastocatellia bacterium]|nr:hypothetical protein [Blastocatellia bacterium]
MKSAVRQSSPINRSKTPLIDAWSTEVRIEAGGVNLEGELSLPRLAQGIVLFAHDQGGRQSLYHQMIARAFRTFGIGTLLVDLLTPEEERNDLYLSDLRYDVGLLAERLVDTSHWLEESESWIREQARPETLRQGYFSVSIGGGAALVAAAVLGESLGAVVLCGGRPDLAGAALAEVKSPSLLIVGGHDQTTLALNLEAYDALNCEKQMNIVSGAPHLPGASSALDEASQLAAGWFRRYLQP